MGTAIAETQRVKKPTRLVRYVYCIIPTGGRVGKWVKGKGGTFKRSLLGGDTKNKKNVGLRGDMKKNKLETKFNGGPLQSSVGIE